MFFLTTLTQFWAHFRTILGWFSGSFVHRLFDAVFNRFFQDSWPSQPSIFVLSPTRRAIFRVFTLSRNTSTNNRKMMPNSSPNGLQNQQKTDRKINQKNTWILIRFWPPKWSQNDSKMEPKLSSGRSLGSLVDSNGLQGTQDTPKASKMDPKRPQNGPL